MSKPREAPFQRWAGDFPGCGDSLCVIRYKGGMVTNGGCRCRPAVLHVVMQRMKKEIEDKAT